MEYILVRSSMGLVLLGVLFLSPLQASGKRFFDAWIRHEMKIGYSASLTRIGLDAENDANEAIKKIFHERHLRSFSDAAAEYLSILLSPQLQNRDYAVLPVRTTAIISKMGGIDRFLHPQSVQDIFHIEASSTRPKTLRQLDHVVAISYFTYLFKYLEQKENLNSTKIEQFKAHLSTNWIPAFVGNTNRTYSTTAARRLSVDLFAANINYLLANLEHEEVQKVHSHFKAIQQTTQDPHLLRNFVLILNPKRYLVWLKQSCSHLFKSGSD